MPPVVIAGGVMAAGAVTAQLLGNKADRDIANADAARKASDAADIDADLGKLTKFDNYLAGLQNTSYMDSIEGKAIVNQLDNNQQSQLNKLGDISSLHNFTAEAKLAGMNNINKNTAGAMAGLAGQAGARRSNLTNQRYTSLSNLFNSEWNAKNQAANVSNQMAQNLYGQNAQNVAGMQNLAGQMGSMAMMSGGGGGGGGGVGFNDIVF